MENKKLLNIAGITSLLEGTFIYAIEIYSSLGLFLIGLGIFFIILSSKSNEEQLKHKGLLIFITIACLIFNPVASIMLFAVIDNLSEYKRKVHGINAPPEEKNIDPELKKIDLLLKLGVGMVFVSGILFATTSWDFINNSLKAFALLLFGLLFLGLSYFTEKKIKLERSSYVYWILAMIFFWLTIVGIEYFGLFGSYLTFTGKGKFLAYFVVMLAIGLLSNLTYFKYKKEGLIYICYISYIIATHNIIMQTNAPIILSFMILSVINIVTYVISNKNDELNKVSEILINVLSLLICVSIFEEKQLMLRISSTLVSIIGLSYLKYTSKEDYLNILGVVISHLLIAVIILSFELSVTMTSLVMFIFLTIYSVSNNIVHADNTHSLVEINNIIYTVLTFIIYLLLLSENALVSLLVVIIYLLFSNASKLQISLFSTSKTFNAILPILIPLIIFPFEELMKIDESIRFTFGIGLSSVFYCTSNFVLTDEREKKRFLTYAIISTIFCLFLNCITEEVVIALFPVLTSLYIMGIYYNNVIKTKVIFPYILFLLSIYYPFVSLNILNFNDILLSIIYILDLLIIIYISKSDLIKKITEIFITLPIYHILTTQNLDIVFENITLSILGLYVLFLIIKFFFQKSKNASVIAIIGICLSIIEIIFQTDIYYGLYIGLVGIIVMVIGYNNEKYSSLFKFGIGIIILNIIVQLNDLWEAIPFWLYLLIAGLGIIGFVTYKEMKKLK